ncbi:MFS transporter [Actinoplanes sp. TBRC 11911]|uniref:MFS transporter n=1 Tax=Actinoplanes sp. TBRC 11911 TaxID=2729386 RepID=UPI00145D119B|nr:MFS transporter [Actinoplanes sp. TBRC 11911]NMO56721.1 MFS transporter [Actinoplanes sp. TBRC 11911]
MTSDQTYPRRWAMLPAVLAGLFMTRFDFNVVNVAAPSLQRDLHSGQAALEMVVGGYAFTYAAGMIIGGRLGDQIGYRRMFLLGITTFGATSLLCGVAQTSGQLVAARLLQGLAGAILVPQILALITAMFPAHERPKAMSWFGVTLAIGAIAGQALGGVLIQAGVFGLDWRVIFLINVPVTIITILASVRLLPHHLRTGRHHRFDVLGSLGITGSLGLVLVPLILGREQHWALWIFITMALAVPVFAATMWWERRSAEPVLDLRLFRSRAFAYGLPANATFMVFFGGFSLVMTLLLQGGLGLSAQAAGLAFLPLAVVFAATSMLGRRLVTRLGGRAVTLGSLVIAAGLLVMIVELHVEGGHITVALLLPINAILGLGEGLAVLALIGSILSNVAPAEAGSAAGVLTTAQNFASAAGVAILGSVFFAFLGSGTGLEAYTGSSEKVAAIALVFVLGTAGLAALIGRPEPATRISQAPAATGRG